MSCTVAGLINCACIWIKRSRRLFCKTLAPPADEFELADGVAPSAGAAVAGAAAEPSLAPPCCAGGDENESSEPVLPSSGGCTGCKLEALACMSNIVCKVCASNCGDELPDVTALLDDPAPPEDAVAPVVVPWLWPNAANSDAIGSDCAPLLAEESGCSRDCHKA